ncbi:MAG: S46 family peptidase, partial [Planctomycetota bacterium]
KEGVRNGELVFVSGHPGNTDRLRTMAHLALMRDRIYPLSLSRLRRLEVLLSTYSERSRENARRAQDELFGIENRRKARLGALAGLQDPEIMARKRKDEKQLREAVSADPKLKESVGGAWDDVTAALKTYNNIFRRYEMYEGGAAFNTELFSFARVLARIAAEDPKPNADRLREYRESNRESLNQWLFSEAPLYADLETIKLADSLGFLVEEFGARDPLVDKILAGKSPRRRAAELIGGTKLFDVSERKRLAEGGRAAIEASQDPLIELALLVDPTAREVRKVYEEQVDEPLRQAYGKIAEARFALYGTSVYPDATFTLRLALGVVAGYEEDGRRVPPWTVIGGAFERAAEHDNREPYQLPESWIASKDRLNLETPLNFVSTVDIIGGNSGSPVVNRAGEVVGLIFDGNLQSLVWDYIYDDVEGRAISVDCRGIVEALRRVYQADALADQLGQ